MGVRETLALANVWRDWLLGYLPSCTSRLPGTVYRKYCFTVTRPGSPFNQGRLKAWIALFRWIHVITMIPNCSQIVKQCIRTLTEWSKVSWINPTYVTERRQWRQRARIYSKPDNHVSSHVVQSYNEIRLVERNHMLNLWHPLRGAKRFIHVTPNQW